jgi:hypothetical protein
MNKLKFLLIILIGLSGCNSKKEFKDMDAKEQKAYLIDNFCEDEIFQIIDLNDWTPSKRGRINLVWDNPNMAKDMAEILSNVKRGNKTVDYSSEVSPKELARVSDWPESKKIRELARKSASTYLNYCKKFLTEKATFCGLPEIRNERNCRAQATNSFKGARYEFMLESQQNLTVDFTKIDLLAKKSEELFKIYRGRNSN